MRLLLTGGGTGGHIYPALAVNQAAFALARAHGQVHEALWVGGRGAIEERLARRAGLEFAPISVGGIVGQTVLVQARNVWRLTRAFWQVRQVIRSFHPQAVLATGGYVSAAVVAAANRERVPVLIYLPDLAPGLAIRSLSRLAAKIAVSFSEVVQYFERTKTVVTGYPVREEFFRTDPATSRAHFQLNADLPVVTVFGGSRGASSINRALGRALPGLLEMTQIIHISGTRDFDAAEQQRHGLPDGVKSRYRLVPYLDEGMPLALSSADLIVARAGAATLGEFPALQKPSLLIPYPYAGQHQDKNAEFLTSRGAAAKLDDAKLEGELSTKILLLLGDRDGLAEMARRSGMLARPEAANTIAELLTELAA